MTGTGVFVGVGGSTGVAVGGGSGVQVDVGGGAASVGVDVGGGGRGVPVAEGKGSAAAKAVRVAATRVSTPLSSPGMAVGCGPIGAQEASRASKVTASSPP